MIPEFTNTGNLPPGIHMATWTEFQGRFGYNQKRIWLLEGLKMLLNELTKVRCSAVYVDGSFVTNKEIPKDYDLCWKMEGVLIEDLDPVLTNYTLQGKMLIEEKYRGDIRGAEFSVRETGASYLDFFQHDRDGRAKGVVELTPLDGEYHD
jgi:hypothetical protein